MSTFYLREERYFRNLYDVVRKKDEKDIYFSMQPIRSGESFFVLYYETHIFDVLLTNLHSNYGCSIIVKP